jgi:MFS family permease
MTNQKKKAYQFIILMGIVSLFGDITYEGARSVTGPYLAFLGASAVTVGFATGLGEFLGYAFRLVSGYLADKTKAYWSLTFIGYGMILAIPFLAYTHHWQMAIFLIIIERMGKAIRSPARDAILSYATKQVGRGWGFAIHEAMDQVGAIIGPLIFSLIFLLKKGYREGFGLLWIPALLVLVTLYFARREVPVPHILEEPEFEKKEAAPKLSQSVWLYLFFTACCVGGFVGFPLISYHFKVKLIISDIQIPFLYALAMAVDGLAALAVGKLYDKVGLKVLLVAPLLTAFIPFFIFLNSYSFVVVGVVLWGIVMGVHETILRAAVADLTPLEKRGVAYGIFNTVYGLFLFLGNAFIGYLYGYDFTLITVFIVATEFWALVVLFIIFQKSSKELKN